MENQQQVIIEEMRKLIAKSCKATDTENNDYYGFQKAFLKFYFNVIEATIDFDEQVIHLWNSKPRTPQDFKLYDINESVVTKVSYGNLEETLKGCLEEGELQSRFYKSMLYHYNGVEETDTRAVSA
jgi:hypothetical protein